MRRTSADRTVRAWRFSLKYRPVFSPPGHFLARLGSGSRDAERLSLRDSASSASMQQRSRRNLPQNSKQGALAQLRAIKSGDAKRSEQFEVRLPLIAPSGPSASRFWDSRSPLWLCSSKKRARSTRT